MRAGHIPGSTSAPAVRLVDRETPRATCRADELRGRLRARPRAAAHRHLLRRRHRGGIRRARAHAARRDARSRSTTARSTSGRPTRRCRSSRPSELDASRGPTRRRSRAASSARRRRHRQRAHEVLAEVGGRAVVARGRARRTARTRPPRTPRPAPRVTIASVRVGAAPSARTGDDAVIRRPGHHDELLERRREPLRHREGRPEGDRVGERGTEHGRMAASAIAPVPRRRR